MKSTMKVIGVVCLQVCIASLLQVQPTPGSAPAGPPAPVSSPAPIPEPISKHVKGQRFEVISHGQGCVDVKQFPNYKDKDNKGCIDRSSMLWDIDVIHDLDSGIEFICATADHQLSCFATGRTWK